MRRIIPAAIVAIIAVVAWFALRGNEPRPLSSPGQTGPSSSAVEPREATAPSGTAPAADATPDRAPVAVDDGKDWILRGRVLRASSTPYPGARIAIEATVGLDESGTDKSKVELVADAEGRFAWKREPPSTHLFVRVHGAMEHHGGWADTARVLHGEAPPQDMEVYVYPLDAVVTGRVTDTADRPIHGAWIKVGEMTIPCDETGTYRVEVGSAFRETYITGGAPQCVEQRFSLVVEHGREYRHDFKLAPGLRIAGHVEDEAHLPIAGAKVSTFFGSRDVPLTDDRGRFELFVDPARANHSLQVRKIGYAIFEKNLSAAEATAEQVLVLPRGTRVEGKVTGPDGKPIVGAELYIGFSPSAWNRIDAVSDDQGHFVFPAVGAGGQTLVTQKRGMAPDHRAFTLTAQDRERVVDIQLTAGHFLAGHVVDAAGKPIAEVRVAVQVAQPGASPGIGRGDYIDVHGQTDAAGAFRVDGLPTGNVTLEFYSSRWMRKEVPVIAVDRSNFSVTLDPAGALAGKVVDDLTGNPITDFTIRVVRFQGGISATFVREGKRFHDEKGAWDTADEQLLPGTEWGVEARAEGYAPARNLKVLAAQEPDPEACVLRLKKGAIVAGLVVSTADNAPIEGATITWFDDEQELEHARYEPYGLIRAVTDATGRFELEDVPAGATKLSIEATGRPRRVEWPFDTLSGERITRTIVVPDGGKVHGVIRDEKGALATGGHLSLALRERSSRTRFEHDLDSTGHFEFGGLPAGEYDLSGHVRREGAAIPFGRRITVADGADLEVDLAPAGTGILRGRLETDAEPQNEVFITLWPDPPSETGQPLLQGRSTGKAFELCGIPAGSYDVMVWAGSLTGSAKVTVANGAAVDLIVTLKQAR
ncbi:MAG: carboxypeptidase-like regulatory domain-containing protein [Planctomycetota bacterium]